MPEQPEIRRDWFGNEHVPQGPGHSAFVFDIGDLDQLAAEHDIEIGETIYDDGVWLSCACGWEANLPHPTSLHQANQVAAEHRREAANRKPG